MAESDPTATQRPIGPDIRAELSAQTVTTRTVVKKKGNTRVRTVTRSRTYPAPSYYGYYGPTYYERPYSRPATVTLGLGGWW